ncbi:hypothetical protein [Vacuolonema iberomarrocanum]|uniref:hypothetical protein n=1 Tax=Vacuolonema iberomarrocanum TaxID=3454632 RepID=UPI003F6E227B
MIDNFCLIGRRKRDRALGGRSPRPSTFRLVLAMLLGGWLSFSVAVSAAQAAYCRTVEGHEVCILDIHRSAKNYWEYRARVSVDGEARPMAVYDCRDRTLLRPDGTRVSFRNDITGDVVCRLFRR